MNEREMFSELAAKWATAAKHGGTKTETPEGCRALSAMFLAFANGHDHGVKVEDE